MKILILSLSLFLSSFISPLHAQVSLDKLHAELKAHYEASDLPGFSISVVYRGGNLITSSHGFADVKNQIPYSPSSLQNLGSVSKTFTGLALVKAIEHTELTMSSPINDFLPFEIHNPRFPDQPILVKHLANHTSSILDTKYYGQSYVLDIEPEDTEGMHTDYLEFIRSHEKMELADFVKKILSKEGKWYKKKNFLKSAPGTEKEYSNLNAAIAALIVEQSSGMSFKDFTWKYIFEPLKMNNTAWSFEDLPKEEQVTLYFPSKLIVPKFGLNTYPDGGLVSNVDDLKKYLTEMIRAFRGESTYLSYRYAKLLLPGDNDDFRAFWGMGEKSRNIGHGGSDPGAQTDIQFNADTRIGRIILCNVNAEDNEALWEQYSQIHKIIAKYENDLLDP
ncbi:MAG: serine hydrolase domain-containing protein [Bacteroidota bacterium]